MVCLILMFYDGQYKRLHCDLSDPLVRKSDKGSNNMQVSPENSGRPLLSGAGDEVDDSSSGVDARVVRVGSVDNVAGASARASVSWDTSLAGSGHTEQKYVS